MNRSLRIVERARTDVDAIFSWLVRRSVQGAISWYLAFKGAVARVAAAGETYGLAPEGERFARDLREALFKTRRGKNYRIVFEISDTEIVILRVRGPGQALLRRRDLPKE
jgi:plasmid stabilization system protein ParE